MLTVKGMPHLSKLASCWVKVANSCNLGLRLRWRSSRNTTGISEEAGLPLPLLPARSLAAAAAVAAFEPSTATGNNPNFSICDRAAARSGTSKTPCTTSPLRRRALYANCGI